MVTFNEEIKKLLKNFIDQVDLKEYLIYGSCAYAYYTNEEVPISDIDIIVSKKEFPQIIEKVKKFEEYDIFPFEKTIHINSKQIIGNNGTPFDISIDSYEDYFVDFGVKMLSFEIDIIYNLKYINKQDLINLYIKTQETHLKSMEYKRKVACLLNIKDNSS